MYRLIFVESKDYDVMVMSSYFRGVANEALVFTAWLWRLIVPTHRTSGDMGME